MKKSVFQFGLICAAATALSVSAIANSSDSPSANDSSGTSRSESADSSSSDISGSNNQVGTSSESSTTDNWSNSKLSATGRSNTSQQAVRGSKLMGAEVMDSSGDRIGRIEDVIVNPKSGKIDFAVIAQNRQTAGSSRSSTSNDGSRDMSESDGTSGAHTQNKGTGEGMNEAQGGTGSDTTMNTGSASGMNHKLVPVPWSLLQPSSSSSSRVMPGSEQSFTLSVDRSKLDSAPALDRGSWAEIGKSGWVQRVNSYYGIPESGNSSMGASESPSGSAAGGGSSDEGSDARRP